MRAPSRETLEPANNDCHKLGAPGFVVQSCVTATGPHGTVTAITEAQAHTVEYEVFRREASTARLALIANNVPPGGSVSFHAADLMHDGDTKIVAIERGAPGEVPVATDVIEGSGEVALHVPMSGTNATVGPASPGGLETWSGSGSSAYEQRRYSYEGNNWRLVQDVNVSPDQVPKFPARDGFAQ